MLSTSKEILFSGPNDLLKTGAVDLTLIPGTWAIIKVSGHQYRWLAGGYELEIVHF